MAEPSKLPSAWELAQSAKAKYTAQWGGTRPPLPDDIDKQADYFFARNELQTIYLSTLIDKHAFAARPNEGHDTIADLMLSKAVQAVVTTNVDELIEHAGHTIYGQIESAIDGISIAAFSPETVPLLKIHGCRRIDWLNTIWCTGQLPFNPVKDRVTTGATWIQNKFVNRDILIIGYWTDWDYLNSVVDSALNAVNPSRVIVVNSADAATFPEKAKSLYDLGTRATNGFYHVQVSGTEFLAGLRRMFSQRFIRIVLQSGKEDFEDQRGTPPNAAWLEPATADNVSLWLMRRDLLGCRPNAPAESSTPPTEPLLGLTLLELQAAGATAEGPCWRLNGSLIRVLRTPNQLLHKAEAMYDGDLAPVVASDFVVAVGAQSTALPPSIARGGGTASIARTSGSTWLSYGDAKAEFGL